MQMRNTLTRPNRSSYCQATVEAALLLSDLVPDLTNTEIARAVGVRSKETIRSWKNLDMSGNARATRLQNRCDAHRILTPSEEQILAGAILYRDLLRLDTTTIRIRKLIFSMFRIDGVYPSYISRFLDRNHLSLRLPTVCHTAERRAASVDELTKYLQEIRSLGVPPDRIVNIDPTSVYSDVRFVKQAGPRGRYALLFSSSLLNPRPS